MRWNDKTRIHWIELIGEALYEFSSDIELIDFQEGAAQVDLLKGEYSEDYHINLQEFIDSKTGGGVAIFFPDQGSY